MKTIFFLLLSLVLLSCQGGKKQNVQPTDTIKEDEFIASVLYTAPPYYVIGKDTIYNYATDPIFPVHTSDPENPLLSIDLKNYVQKKLADVHLGKGIVDVAFLIDKKGYVRQVIIEKSAEENGASPNVAARMDSIACKVIADLPRFTAPATRKGKPVNFLKRWTVRFE